MRPRAEREGLEKAAAALKLVRKETPAAVGRGQAIGELGEGAALEEAAFTLPEKSLSAPVRTAAGFAILRVLEQQGHDPRPSRSRRRRSRSRLRQQKRDQLFQAYMNQARDRYAIERNPEALQARDGAGP